MGTPISVVICTLNEEPVIERCVSSVPWADEVLVLDSGSTDGTRERAEAFGATVREQQWLGFSKQKNLAASLARNDWVLSLDADEIVTPELSKALQDATSSLMDPRDGYGVDRRDDFLGVLLPSNARRSKRWRVRLYNRRSAAWDESMRVHELVRVQGRVHRLPGVLIQWNDLSLDELVVLFNRYATAEAEELHRSGRRATAASVVVRPLLRFGWHYVVRGEARLGSRGLVHAALKASSEFMRYAKLWELNSTCDDSAGLLADDHPVPAKQERLEQPGKDPSPTTSTETSENLLRP